MSKQIYDSSPPVRTSITRRIKIELEWNVKLTWKNCIFWLSINWGHFCYKVLGLSLAFYFVSFYWRWNQFFCHVHYYVGYEFSYTYPNYLDLTNSLYLDELIPIPARRLSASIPLPTPQRNSLQVQCWSLKVRMIVNNVSFFWYLDFCSFQSYAFQPKITTMSKRICRVTNKSSCSASQCLLETKILFPRFIRWKWLLIIENINVSD